MASPRRLVLDGRRRWFPDLRAVARSRQLVILLSRRDITARYRQTVLGSFWIFAGPLASAGLFTFVFGRVADLPSNGIPYFAYSFAALIGWNLFSSQLGRAAGSMTNNSALVTKIYFPRLVLPLSTLASNLINTSISFVVMIGILLVYDIGFTARMLVLPLFLLLAIVLAMGIGIMLGAAVVSYRDVNYITPVFTSLLLYISPVAYSIDAVPDELRSYYYLNPITTIAEGCRWALLGQADLPLWAIAYTTALAVGILLVGMCAFTRLESRFADVI